VKAVGGGWDVVCGVRVLRATGSPKMAPVVPCCQEGIVDTSADLPGLLGGGVIWSAVIPAKAGIHAPTMALPLWTSISAQKRSALMILASHWIPAFAGMTVFTGPPGRGFGHLWQLG
jgi:hypothetical protein